jgi:V8-like Glu-specific endopeptidase
VFIGEKYEGGTGAQGTGTFITPNIILTCAHNVLNQYKLGGTMIAKEIHFYPGLSKQND